MKRYVRNDRVDPELVASELNKFDIMTRPDNDETDPNLYHNELQRLISSIQNGIRTARYNHELVSLAPFISECDELHRIYLRTGKRNEARACSDVIRLLCDIRDGHIKM